MPRTRKSIPRGGYVNVKPEIIQEVHALVQEHRKNLGMEPWDFTKAKDNTRKRFKKAMVAGAH